jgi:hypothetical protein
MIFSMQAKEDCLADYVENRSIISFYIEPVQGVV